MVIDRAALLEPQVKSKKSERYLQVIGFPVMLFPPTYHTCPITSTLNNKMIEQSTEARLSKESYNGSGDYVGGRRRDLGPDVRRRVVDDVVLKESGNPVGAVDSVQAEPAKEENLFMSRGDSLIEQRL